MKNKNNDIFNILNSNNTKIQKAEENIPLKTSVDNISSNLDIDISLISVNPNQPRKTFDDASILELANSIKNVGLIQPITVVKSGSGYIIVSGERRYRAYKLLNFKTIPCIVRDYSAREQEEIALIENIQREDLNPIEEALAYKKLIDNFSMTQEELALKLGKSRPAITNSLRLLQLSPEVIALVNENKLSAGHARALVSIKDSRVQLSFAKQASERKISVNDLEKMVSAYLNPKRKEVKIKPPVSLELKNLINNFQTVFGTHVQGFGNEEKGRIIIDYFCKEDIQRIFDIINILKNY